MTRTSGRLVAVAAVAMLASTTTTCADPAEPEVAAPAWDLTDGRSLARIDWSPAAGEDTYLRHHDDLVVDLPGGTVIDVAEIGGPARVSALRYPEPDPEPNVLQMMIFEFPRTTVEGAATKATRLCEHYRIEHCGRFRAWPAGNPRYPGGGAVYASRDLPGGKVAIEVEARVRAGQDGVVIIGLTWNDPATGAGG